MELLWTLVIGAVVGWLAGMLMKAKLSLIASMVVGILGSFLGGWLFGLLRISAFGLIGHIIISVIGAMILIALLRKLKV